MIMIAPPWAIATKPGSAAFPFQGWTPHRRQRRQLGRDPVVGATSSQEAPAMLRGIYGDPERYEQTYWSRFESVLRRRRGQAGRRRLLLGCSRVDDVMNISGHRISTTEVESALATTTTWPRRR